MPNFVELKLAPQVIMSRPLGSNQRVPPQIVRSSLSFHADSERDQFSEIVSTRLSSREGDLEIYNTVTGQGRDGQQGEDREVLDWGEGGGKRKDKLRTTTN